MANIILPSWWHHTLAYEMPLWERGGTTFRCIRTGMRFTEAGSGNYAWALTPYGWGLEYQAETRYHISEAELQLETIAARDHCFELVGYVSGAVTGGTSVRALMGYSDGTNQSRIHSGYLNSNNIWSQMSAASGGDAGPIALFTLGRYFHVFGWSEGQGATSYITINGVRYEASSAATGGTPTTTTLRINGANVNGRAIWTALLARVWTRAPSRSRQLELYADPYVTLRQFRRYRIAPAAAPSVVNGAHYFLRRKYVDFNAYDDV